MPATAVPADPACAGDWTAPTTPVSDPGALRVEWTWTGPVGWRLDEGGTVTPLVGPLLDGDGDGDVDRHDPPSVVVVACRSAGSGRECTVAALDGRTGEEQWRREAASVPHALIWGDLDGDGAPEVFTSVADGRAALLSGEGYREWVADALPTTNDGAQATVADLDADGVPEILFDDLVLDGATGALEARLETTAPWTGGGHAAVDVDGDGTAEIAWADGLFSADGARLWTTAEAVPATGPWPIPVQADPDADAELLFVGDRLALYDTDGTLLSATPFAAGTTAGPACAGDLDGDGLPEVVVPTWSPGTLTAHGLDGAVRWTRPLTDVDGHAGCVTADLDGDLRQEVIHAGENAVFVYDGATGAVVGAWADAASSTRFETVAVADVDGDGHAELVVVGDGHGQGFAGVAVLGHAGAGWTAAGPAWATVDYATTQVTADGEVPTAPVPAWSTVGVWRGRLAADGAPPRPAPGVEVLGRCAADCTWGPGRLQVRAVNRGGAPMGPGRLTVSGGGWSTTRAVDGLGPGRAGAAVGIDLPVEALGAPLSVVLTPVDPGPTCGQATVELTAACPD